MKPSKKLDSPPVASELYHFSFKAMGSPCHLQFYTHSQEHAELVFNLAFRRIEQLEQRYSRYLEDSLISIINRRAGTGIKTPIDNNTFALLQYAEQCFRESGRLFDITSGVLRRIWHFDQTKLPTSSEINNILPCIGWQKVEWNEHFIYLPIPGMELDFGGIVKEYTADVVAGLCLQQSILSGVIELGGDIRVLGPLPDGRGWPVAIRDPRQTDKKLIEFTMKKGSLATSGDYERFQLINGVRYSHLLNPKTGWPVNGLRAVSVVAAQCVVAGSLATIAMLKGRTGLNWLKKLPVEFLCCTSDGKIVNHLNS